MYQKKNNPNMRQHVRVFSRVLIQEDYELKDTTKQPEHFQGAFLGFFMGGAAHV